MYLKSMQAKDKSNCLLFKRYQNMVKLLKMLHTNNTNRSK